MTRSRGVSLVELSLVVLIFSGFMLVLFGLLRSGRSLWDRANSSQDVLLQLQKARAALVSDLRETRFLSCRVGTNSAATPGQPGGNVVWFLSAVDPTTGVFRTDGDGNAFWCCNIMYYTAVPTEHDRLFGAHCQGQDDRCPHKLLIRRVFQQVTDPSKEEVLLSRDDSGARAVAPPGYQLSEIPGPAALSSEVVAVGLLELDVQVAPRPLDWPREVQVAISGFDVAQAGQKTRVGQESLRQSPFTQEILLSVFPGN